MLPTTEGTPPFEGNRASPTTTESRNQNAQPRVRRRNRQINSCLECRRRKLKCDKGSPCSNCTKNARPCVFIASSLDADAQKKLAEVKEKMASLEDDVALLSRSGNPADGRRTIALPGQDQDPDSDQEDDEDVKNMDLSRLTTDDAAYYDDDVNDDDDFIDLGIAMGRMRITERIGGLVRPRFAEELTQTLRALPPSGRPPPETVPEQDPQIWLAPSRDYVAPSSSFLFGPGVEKTSVMTYLPPKFTVDKLLLHYWDAVHVVARMVHRPSFERQLDKFWADVATGIEPRASFQAMVYAMLLSSVVSMHENAVLVEFGVTKQHFVGTFRHCCEAALTQANFLRSTKFEPLQAFVMYLVPLCRGEVSRAHSALTGTAIRLAECMGLYRDPTSYSRSPIEIQMRRLVWHQICFLDSRTSEATGPRHQIRHGDYDTSFPLNIDDEDLDRAENGDSGVDVKHDSKHFTTMTITRMRFECYEMTRLLYHERPRLELKRAKGERKVTLVSLLSRIQSFKAAMEKTYLPMLSKSVPLHALASEIYGILQNRLYIVILQKYLSSDRSKMPTRLRQLVMSAAVSVVEHAINIDQQPALATWSWYLGALSQHHPALLLLNEVYAAQNDPDVEIRIWRCMDFAFGLDPGGSNDDKFRYILEELAKKSTIYSNMKGLRAPAHMPHVGSRTLTKTRSGQQERQQSPTSRFSPNVSNTYLPGPSTGFQTQQTSPPPQVQHTPPTTSAQPYNQQASRPPMSFPGAVPQVEWGTIDFSAPLPSLHNQFDSPEPFNFNDYTASMSMGPIVPSGTLAGMTDHRGSDTASTSGMGAYGSTGSSPMDALNDIDWNEIDKMFGNAETVAGMMVPPYSFPQFEPNDLDM